MAEGRTNVGIGRRSSILGKRGLATSDDDHRRVLAVVLYLSRHPHHMPEP